MHNGTAFGDEFPMQLPIAVNDYLSGLEMKKYKYKSAKILPKKTPSPQTYFLAVNLSIVLNGILFSN